MTVVPDLAVDPGLARVLHHLGVDPASVLGHGGEAWVFALDDGLVARVLHGQTGADIEARSALVSELRRTDPPFELPRVVDVGSIDGRHYAIERRLPGRPVAAELTRLGRPARDRLIDAHLDTAASLGQLRLDRRDWFGDLIGPAPIRAPTWPGYLITKIGTSFGRAPGFEQLDPHDLTADLLDALGDCGPDSTGRSRFVHLDAFAGNMLADGPTITAVLDIGATSIVGDSRLDPVSAVVYLCSDAITPEADQADRARARRWLQAAGLAACYEPARRWLAGYWAFVVDDLALHRWCRHVLL